MQVFNRTNDLRKALLEDVRGGKSVGLVPTMGALHPGHTTLLSTCISEVDVSVCSIFVNPIQFNNKDDYSKYPKSLDDDLNQLKQGGCTYAFVPEDTAMYPTEPLIGFDAGKMGSILEGKFRPGHFNGVLLVVSKLLNIVQPNIAYFGQKDLQQYSLIRQMVTDCSFQVELRQVPTVRDDSGLALSSRNRRLSPQELKEAASLYIGLTMVREHLHAGGQFSEAKNSVAEYLSNFASVKLEYLELVVLDGFEIAQDYDQERDYGVVIAAYVGEVRLIDNIILG